MQRSPFKRIERLLDAVESEFSHARMGMDGEIGTAAVDVAESDGEFVVRSDLPGFVQDDIKLRVTDHTLHLHAEHKGEHEFEEEGYLHRERRHTDVSRSVPLPEDIDEDAASAIFDGGVLTVTLPKAKSGGENGHTISIS